MKQFLKCQGDTHQEERAIGRGAQRGFFQRVTSAKDAPVGQPQQEATKEQQRLRQALKAAHQQPLPGQGPRTKEITGGMEMEMPRQGREREHIKQ